MEVESALALALPPPPPPSVPTACTFADRYDYVGDLNRVGDTQHNTFGLLMKYRQRDAPNDVVAVKMQPIYQMPSHDVWLPSSETVSRTDSAWAELCVAQQLTAVTRGAAPYSNVVALRDHAYYCSFAQMQREQAAVTRRTLASASSLARKERDDWIGKRQRQRDEWGQETGLTARLVQFAVYDYCEGGTVDDYLKRHPRAMLDGDAMRSLLVQVLGALVRYERLLRFTHGDLKLSNLMLTTAAPLPLLLYDLDDAHFVVPLFAKRFLVKLIDFGWSRIAYRSGNAVVVVSAAAAEDVGHRYNPSLDLHRLGVSILHRLCDAIGYGRGGVDAIQHLEEVDPQLWSLCKAMLARPDQVAPKFAPASEQAHHALDEILQRRYPREPDSMRWLASQLHDILNAFPAMDIGKTPATLLLTHPYFAPARDTTHHYENAVNMLASIQLPTGFDPVREDEEDEEPVDLDEYYRDIRWHSDNLAQFQAELRAYDERFVLRLAKAIRRRERLELSPVDELMLVSYLHNGTFPPDFVAAVVESTGGAAVDVSESERDKARLFPDESRLRDSSAVYLAVRSGQGEFGAILVAARVPLLFTSLRRRK